MLSGYLLLISPSLLLGPSRPLSCISEEISGLCSRPVETLLLFCLLAALNFSGTAFTPSILDFVDFAVCNRLKSHVSDATKVGERLELVCPKIASDPLCELFEAACVWTAAADCNGFEPACLFMIVSIKLQRILVERGFRKTEKNPIV